MSQQQVWPSGTRWRSTAAAATATHKAASAAAVAAALYMHIKLTSRLLGRHLNHHRTYFYTGAKKGNWRTKKTPSGIRKTDPQGGKPPTCYPTLFLTWIDRD